jgi:nitrite reductase/ring-hydroxylating ferredoxin subunit
MKKLLYLIFAFSFLFSCSKNDVVNTNPFLPNYNFSIDINTNLPEYSSLKYAGNSVYYAGAGIRGLLIFNTGSGYNAFDAACPNQTLSTCSTMTTKDIYAVCACDSKQYSLYTGQSDLQYPMKQYRVEANGNIIRVYN